MGFFAETARAAVARRRVSATMLAFLDFKTTPMRLHPGFGDLVAGGFTWSGLGGLGTVSGLESAIGGAAPRTTFTLSGVDTTLIAAALADSSEVKNRPAQVLLQFFDPDSFATLDAPYVVAQLTMDTMTIKGSGTQRTVDLTAETVWVRQDSAPWAYLSDRNQQARFPGDNGLDQVPLMQTKSVNWPVFSS